MAEASEGKYGKVLCSMKEFHDDEPVFILRATDPLAPAAIESYAKRCYGNGCDDGHIEAVMAHAERMREWQRNNPRLVKNLPD